MTCGVSPELNLSGFPAVLPAWPGLPQPWLLCSSVGVVAFQGSLPVSPKRPAPSPRSYTCCMLIGATALPGMICPYSWPLSMAQGAEAWPSLAYSQI